MKVETTYNSGLLTIVIDGRVDAAEASNFQNSIQSALDDCDEVDEIIIDASKLTFISSMGLRVILALRKNYENLRVIGVSFDVFNVFKITGFHKIITVEKALEQVSIDGCEKVHGMKDVYKLTEETVLKVFPEGTTKEDVDNEVALAKEVFVLGIPTAMAFDIVKVGERFGLIYESTIPALVDAKVLGDMLRNMHELKVDPEGKFPFCHEVEKEQISALEPYLGKEAVDNLTQMLSVLPDDSSLLHGNLSLDCVMMQNGEPIFTNMSSVGYGNPVLDLAHLYSSLTEEQKKDYFAEFLLSYYDMESEDTIAKFRQNIEILSMIMDFTSLLSDGEPSAEAVEISKKQFKERITDHWDEILSHLRFKMDFAEEIRKLERKNFYLDSEVDIDWVASRLGTNRHYVSDYFNKVLHTTFNDYINGMRLDYAEHLIKEGRIPMSQIVFSAGFNNDHTFRRLFKQKFGCLPSQYKK